jgi:hypothetical protein
MSAVSSFNSTLFVNVVRAAQTNNKRAVQDFCDTVKKTTKAREVITMAIAFLQVEEGIPLERKISTVDIFRENFPELKFAIKASMLELLRAEFVPEEL